jgi:hypothetical protein
MNPIFNGPTCVASLPDGFVLTTANVPMKTGVVSVCNAITNGLTCTDNTRWTADSFFYTCQDANTNCETDNRSAAVSAAIVCGEYKKGFEYTGIDNPKLSGCDIGVCDASSIPKGSCNPPCTDPVNQICTIDPFDGGEYPFCFGLPITV